MSYIEKIRNNVVAITETTELAKAKKVSYTVAKIMYHNGKKDIDLESAMELASTLKGLKISPFLINKLDLLTEYKNGNQINLKTIYKQISKYANRKYINELNDYIFSNDHYGEKIYNLMKSGIPIKLAIKIYEIQIKQKKKETGLSELATLANMLWFESETESLLFEKEYLNKRAVKGSPGKTIKNALLSSGDLKSKKVNGITLLSKNEEGIQKLESLINYAYINGNATYLKVLFEHATKKELIISDFKLNKSDGEYFKPAYDYICLSLSSPLESIADSFFHETSHFLDYEKGHEIDKYHYSIDNLEVKNILEKIKSKRNITLRGIELEYFKNFKSAQYVHNRILREKWFNQIKLEHHYASRKDLKQYMKQRILYERKKYKVFISSIEDIYDGLSGGKLATRYLIDGHGKEYYSNPENLPIEFIANIGTLYNHGGLDVLRFEFGEEITNEIIEIYETSVGIKSYTQSQQRAI